MTERILSNIHLKNTIEPLSYKSSGKPGAPLKLPKRDSDNHFNYLKRQFDAILADQDKESTKKPNGILTLKRKNGTYLEFSGMQNYELIVRSLENIPSGIRLLNVRDENEVIKATVYVPNGKELFFMKKLEMYKNGTKSKSGKNKFSDLIDGIEEVKIALIEAFWIGKKKDIPDKVEVWCEVWLRVDNYNFKEVEQKFREICLKLKIELDEKLIDFPERIVKLVKLNSSQIITILESFEYLAEIRRADEVNSEILDIDSKTQMEFIDDLLERTIVENSKSSICLLDTGVNNVHSLLNKFILDSSLHTVESSWGSNDHRGHGTEMAGISLYNDLSYSLNSAERIFIKHNIESVKILPNLGENNSQLFGSITQNAVYLAESVNPDFNRTLCMAVTSSKYNTNDGTPTSWSAALDNISFGREDKTKRLFFISGGNLNTQEFNVNIYPEANYIHSIENPGQSWNSITVGAYTNLIYVNQDRFIDYYPVADVGELSPFSSTSKNWSNKWPIKPEILCEGGNMLTNGSDFDTSDDLSILTTYHKPLFRLLSTLNGTSASTAKASWISAQIMANYPQIWPETVRALIIHSARWTEKMKKQFCKIDQKMSGRNTLLRTCGYGIPNLERAMHCLSNSVNLVIEGEIQPYNKEGMNDMHLHKIPWPNDVLRQLGNIDCELRVTLSYFIEPGPGEIGWKDKYRYPSCGLRFDVINKDEKRTDFVKRINIKMRENSLDKGDGTSGSDNWYLGSRNRDVGSIHSDFKRETAVDFCDSNYIAIYPVNGWWKERKNLKSYNKKVRYSLIVSISTPNTEIDLYNPIMHEVSIQNKSEIQIEVNSFST